MDKLAPARNGSLDGLRALAALTIVAYHARLSPLLGGFIGVEVFFVLSGYLITGLLRDEIAATGERPNYLAFWRRRAIRLIPALWIVILVCVVLGPVVFAARDRDIYAEAALAAGYLSNDEWFFAVTPKALSHTWSLAVEAQFYLLWPVIFGFLLGAFPKRTPHVLTAFFVAALLWRAQAWFGRDHFRAYTSFDTNLASLALGCRMAFVKWRPSEAAANVLGFSCLTALALAAVVLKRDENFSSTLGCLLVDLAAAGLIIAVSDGRSIPSKLLAAKPLVRLGLWSYPLYLWHYPLMRTLQQFLPLKSLGLVACTGIGAVGLAALTHELVERPLGQWARSLARRV